MTIKKTIFAHPKNVLSDQLNIDFSYCDIHDRSRKNPSYICMYHAPLQFKNILWLHVGPTNSYNVWFRKRTILQVYCKIFWASWGRFLEGI